LKLFLSLFMLKANWQNLRKKCDLLLRYSTWVPVEILPVHSVTSGISIIFYWINFNCTPEVKRWWWVKLLWIVSVQRSKFPDVMSSITKKKFQVPCLISRAARKRSCILYLCTLF
jgi:hypothetical protein